MKQYCGNVNINIDLPDFVNKNEELSKRMLDNFMFDVQNLCSKYSFYSMAHDIVIEPIEEESLEDTEFIDYEPLNINDLEPIPSYNGYTLKDIDAIIRQFYGESTKPLAFNIAHMSLRLLDEDLEKYMNAYQEDCPQELINRFVDIQLKIKELLSDLK